MTTNAITAVPPSALLERVLLHGDLKDLTPADRVEYYLRTCQSVGVNALTRPFEYITLNGKLTLYAKRDCTDQLRSLRQVSVTIVSRERLEDVYVVTARATTPDGRHDESIGAVNIAGLRGDALANCLMKAETKSKRRVTLSICGLGWLDETEVDTVPGARPVDVDISTGEIVTSPSQTPRGNASMRSLPAEPPQPPPVDITRQELWHLWYERAEIASKEHVVFKDPASDISDDGLKKAIKELSKRIKEVREATELAKQLS